MASLPDHLFQELTDALQVLAVVSTHLRRTTSGTMERSWRPTAPEADHVVHQGVQDRLPEGRLSGRIPHDLRRTAVRNLERAGIPSLSGDEADGAQNRIRVSTLCHR